MTSHLRLPTRRVSFLAIGLSVLFAFGVGVPRAYAQTHEGRDGFLKICKIAGPGVAVSTPFNFTLNNSGNVTVPAGPTPNGMCAFAGIFPIGTVVAIDETNPGYDVTNITVAPGSVVAGPNLPAGTVTIRIQPGVNIVTYTNRKQKDEFGYIEICKFAYTESAQGNYTFSVTGVPGTVTVPANACSPPIKVPAGQVVVTEAPMGNNQILNAGTWPSGRQVGFTANTSTVTVPPGGVANETVVGIVNGPKGHTPTPSVQRSAAPPWVMEGR